MERLIVWHATEELEHKAVAFDVLRASHPSYALRVFGFTLATFSLFAWTSAGLRMLLRQDGIDRAARRRFARELRQRDRGEMGRRMGRAIRAYLRRDFHPNQVDDLGPAHRRLAELGIEGVQAPA